MAVYGTFADDSGSHAESPVMILAGLVARHERWKQFADEWDKALIAGKPLVPHKGEIYFKSADAEQRKNCFQGFSRTEADSKVDLLTDVALDHILYGWVCAIKWEHFKSIVQARIPKPRGRSLKFVEHPYDLCFQALTQVILRDQIKRGLHEEIDFAFDKQGKMLPRCIQWYDTQLKPRAPERIRKIMGQVIPGDDKVLLPIQAADLVAWQTRNGSWPYTGRKTTSAKKIVEARKLHLRPISRGELESYVKGFYAAVAVRSIVTPLDLNITPPKK